MSSTDVRPPRRAARDSGAPHRSRRAPLHALRFGPVGGAQIGSDPVMLLHGQPGRAGVWRGVGEALADHDLHAVAVDRPGYGHTGGEPTGFAGNAAAVVDFLDHHDIERATLVTHSWASGVALSLAASHPDRVRAMVLLAPVGAPASVTVLDHLLAVPVLGWGALRGSLRLGAWALDRDATRRYLPKGFGDLDPVMAKRMAGSAMTASARRSAAVEQRALVRELPDVRRRLGDVDVPTVVVSGSHDLIVSPSAAADLAHGIAGARLETVAAGHLLPAEVPHHVAALVAELSG